MNTSKYTASSSARQLASRQGSGRVRHLSGKILWVQEKTQDGAVTLRQVGTSENLADIGTNCLTSPGLLYLTRMSLAMGLEPLSRPAGPMAFPDVSHGIEKQPRNNAWWIFAAVVFIHMRFHSLFFCMETFEQKNTGSRNCSWRFASELGFSRTTVGRSLRVCSWIGRTPGQRRRIA